MVNYIRYISRVILLVNLFAATAKNFITKFD